MSSSRDNNSFSSGKDNEREVLDPVTHLPIKIRDSTKIDLDQIPPPPSSRDQKRLSHSHRKHARQITNQHHQGVQHVIERETSSGRWENFHEKEQLLKVNSAILAAIAAGIGAMSNLLYLTMVGNVGWLLFATCLFNCGVMAVGAGFCILRLWHSHLAHMAPAHLPFPDETGEQGNRNHAPAVPHVLKNFDSNAETDDDPENRPETAAWLNSLIGAVWPIVNPALFTAVADMLEDTLQATLPKLIQGVRIAEIGQGSEPVRIICIRYLEAGDAGVEKQGMAAEEGTFVNLEVAVAYRAKLTDPRTLRGRSGNAHVLIQFWFSGGGIAVPVWVELSGLLANARLRLQLIPNPPFFSILTLTLLGQPKVTIKCTPLAKNFLNVMDIPGLSAWIQRSVDTAVGEYVAPGSLTLDLKTVLMGMPKMDSDSVGVVVVTVRKATYKKEGNAANAYVTLGWSKWGKPLWTTRIIKGPGSGKIVWEETTALLVRPAELNAQELLRLQMWDADRLTADDHLGSFELSLESLMTDSAYRNKIASREDNLIDRNGDPWLGTISWECGYFDKTTFEQQLAPRGVNTASIVYGIETKAEAKLREIHTRDENDENKTAEEVKRQKQNELKEKTDEILVDNPPVQDWPSGILAINIEQINGLSVQDIRGTGVKDGGEDEESDDLPSAYCTVVINHQRVYKTRTKMKSGNPFFAATTEKFIRDWRNTTVIIGVRDYRLHEADPLLGVVVLPLPTLFRARSQVDLSLPLIGGIGYGRMRVSLLFRSIQIKLPTRLLGWDVGTLEVQDSIRIPYDLSADLASCRLAFRTAHDKRKLYSHHDGFWRSYHYRANQKQNDKPRPLRLAVVKRYSSCLTIQFRKRVVGPDLTPAFCVLWFKDIPDNEEMTITLPVWRNANGWLNRATFNAESEDDMLESGAERIAFIDMTIRFWSGLSGYHKAAADSEPHMREIMELLDSAEETKDVSHDLLVDGKGKEAANSLDGSSHGMSSSSTDSSDDTERGEQEQSGKGGPLEELKNYKNKQVQLHRKHRGLMQWRAARNLAWLGKGVEHQAESLKGKMKGLIKVHEKDVGIEHEV